MAGTANAQDRTFRTHVEIPAETREGLIALLNQCLADTFDLFSQVKQAHWNVKGKEFYQLHLLFDEIAEELEEFVDLLAERCTALGGYATGTARMAAERSEIPEYPVDITLGLDHVRALVERLAIYDRRVREGIARAGDLDDPATADLLTDIARAVEKRLWFLEAHLQG